MNVLLVVDLQNDFCPGGSLAVPEGDRIVPVINRLTESFDAVIQTQDWHPEKHHSFASSHEDKEPFETTEMFYGQQILWPDHCIQGTKGAEFHPGLTTNKVQAVIRKGFRREMDSYSAFFENDHKTRTGLSAYLKDRGLSRLYVCGLATDFCVKWTVLDGIREGFDLTVIKDAVCGIDLNGSVARAWHEMNRAGAKRISSDAL